MTHWMRPPELARARERNHFDPVIEGAHDELSRELSLAIWERVCADATDSTGRLDADQAQRQFRELAARIATRGGRLRVGVGRLTRVQTEIFGVPRGAWVADELAPRTPGQTTLVVAEMVNGWLPSHSHLPRDIAKPSAPGRRTLVEDLPSPRLGFDDYRVLGLKEVLLRLGPNQLLRSELIAAAAVADRSIAGRATLWREPLSSPTTPNGHALWHIAERHSATLYRQAVHNGVVDEHNPANESALQQLGTGQPLPMDLRRDMERVLDVSLAGVRIHTDSVAVQAARALNADAFAVGEDIFFSESTFSPNTRSGRQLLANELTHVAQALCGDVGPTSDRLLVSQPGEPHEQEAEAIAESIDQVAASLASAGPAMQGRAAIDFPPPHAAIHRAAADLDAIADHTIALGLADQARGSVGQPLPAGLREQLERSVGSDLGAVRIHVGDASAAAARALHANAYTIGQDIHFAAGRYDPGSSAGQHLIAHEVAHAAWHGGGGNGTVSHPGDGHERDADSFADSFVGLLLRGEMPGVAAPRHGGGVMIHLDAEDDAAADLLHRTTLERGALVRELVRLLDPGTTQVRNEGVGRGTMMQTAAGPVWDSWGGSVTGHTVPFITAVRVLRRLQHGVLLPAQETAAQVVQQLGRTRLAELADSHDGRQVVQVLRQLVPGPQSAPAQIVSDAIEDSNRALQPAVAGSTVLVDRVRGVVALPMSFSWNAMGESHELDVVSREVLAIAHDPCFAQVPPHLQAAFRRCSQTVARAMGDREVERERWRDRLAGSQPAGMWQTRTPMRERLQAMTNMGPIGTIAGLAAIAAGAEMDQAIAVGQAADAAFLLIVPAAARRLPNSAAGGGGLMLTNQNRIALVEPNPELGTRAEGPPAPEEPAIEGQSVRRMNNTQPGLSAAEPPTRATELSAPAEPAAEEQAVLHMSARQRSRARPSGGGGPRTSGSARAGQTSSSSVTSAGSARSATPARPTDPAPVPHEVSRLTVPAAQAYEYIEGGRMYIYVMRAILRSSTGGSIIEMVVKVGKTNSRTSMYNRYHLLASENIRLAPELRDAGAVGLDVEMDLIEVTPPRSQLQQLEDLVRMQLVRLAGGRRLPWDHQYGTGPGMPTGTAIRQQQVNIRLEWENSP